MIEKLDEIKAAKAKIVEGALTIWNARLEALTRGGDFKNALDQMISPVEFGDNCDCHCGEAFLPRELLGEVKPTVKR